MNYAISFNIMAEFAWAKKKHSWNQEMSKKAPLPCRSGRMFVLLGKTLNRVSLHDKLSL